jgi:hypothetical protein
MIARFIVAVLLVSALDLNQSPADTGPPTSNESQKPLYAGGDGLSKGTAIVILSTAEVAGIRCEYSWIRDHYPGSQKLGQALTARDDNGKQYDRITIKTHDGHTVALWFEISAMFE